MREAKARVRVCECVRGPVRGVTEECNPCIRRSGRQRSDRQQMTQRKRVVEAVERQPAQLSITRSGSLARDLRAPVLLPRTAHA